MSSVYILQLVITKLIVPKTIANNNINKFIANEMSLCSIYICYLFCFLSTYVYMSMFFQIQDSFIVGKSSH